MGRSEFMLKALSTLQKDVQAYQDANELEDFETWGGLRDGDGVSAMVSIFALFPLMQAAVETYNAELAEPELLHGSTWEAFRLLAQLMYRDYIIMLLNGYK